MGHLGRAASIQSTFLFLFALPAWIMINRTLGSMARMSRPQLIPAVAVGLLLAVWTIRLQMPAMSVDYSWFRIGEDGRISNTSPQVKGLGRPDVSDIDFSDPDAPFVGWPLERACNEVTEWVEGVVWLCDNNWGGVGNVRNFILTCMRYAIEAGVSGIVMPAIQKRNDDNIVDINSGKDFRPFGYFFDEDNFRQGLGETCPQITIYDSWAHIPSITIPSNNGSWEPEIEKISPREFSTRGNCDGGELDKHTDRFGGRTPSHPLGRTLYHRESSVPANSPFTRLRSIHVLTRLQTRSGNGYNPTRTAPRQTPSTPDCSA